MNLRASAAIADTVRWVRGQLSEGQAVTEAAFQAVANQNYEDHGARDLSFHTISGVGANSAIIHYSGADETVFADTNDLMLLDSGGLYEGGFCTDTTRTFIAGGASATPSDEQKRIYTLVLKGVLSGMSASFPKGTRGSFLDALIRAPLYSAGLDYAHGTGHGVGIHVHEPGVGIAPQASGVIEAGMVCSIEPGYYREGWGGIRIENVVVFEEHSENEGYLCSRPLNHVGFDVHLVDETLFTPDELRAYQNYQSVCATNGTLDMG
jgi:Xaa-Pro aminopeptidase